MRDFEGLEIGKLSPRLQGMIRYVLQALYGDSKHTHKDDLTISMGFSASDTLWLLGAAIECEMLELTKSNQSNVGKSE